MAADCIVVILARYASSRLPGKPLVRIAGVPMIERTYRQCALGFPAERIYVATDDERIIAHCSSVGIQALMTPDTCMTGTDRVAAVAETIEADLYLNVQGDEPLFNPDDIGVMLEAAKKHPGDVLNGVAEIEDPAQHQSLTIPKVVFRPDGRLLYMSRAPIPGNKRGKFSKGWRQICIYAFGRDHLAAFASATSKTPLEEQEDIEILRFLEMGYEVRMVSVSDESIAVDTPEDVAKVEAALAGQP